MGYVIAVVGSICTIAAAIGLFFGTVIFISTMIMGGFLHKGAANWEDLEDVWPIFGRSIVAAVLAGLCAAALWYCGDFYRVVIGG